VAGIDTDTDRAEAVGQTLAEMPFEEAEAVLDSTYPVVVSGTGQKWYPRLPGPHDN
jgi:hypothetical protein